MDRHTLENWQKVKEALEKAGFTVTSSAPAALNTTGGTYIFLAIA